MGYRPPRPGKGRRSRRGDHGRNRVGLPLDFQELGLGVAGWGTNRFSVPWGMPSLTHIVDLTDRWGFDINIYDVPNLESFLNAVLQQPRSVTSDFNFPKWHYYGRGSGEDAQRHEYEERS